MAINIDLPTTQTVLKIRGSSDVALHSAVPLPDLQSSEVLVRVVCVSINQVDAKAADMSPSMGATIGTDFSGTVVRLGNEVAHDKHRESNGMKPLQIGDKVMGGVFGNNPLRHDNGAFAEYVAVPSRLVWHVPSGMDLETASTLPAAIATTGLSLFQYLELPMPSDTQMKGDSAPFVLVYGGGTATGVMAIQVLKLSGFTPVVVCSPASAQRARELGAIETFDYNSPTCGAALREYTSDSLGLALDCITNAASMSICYEALQTSGGRYLALDAFPIRGHTRRSITPDFVVTYSQFGNPVAWAPPYNVDARPEDLRCAEAWYVVAQRMLDEGLLHPHPHEVRTGGLARVSEGMKEVLKSQIKGRKLVYPLTAVSATA